jgi:hypothetical protein
MEAERTRDAVAAWTRALQRCVASRSHALVDASVVLVFADAPRVFHPVQAIIQDQGGSDDADDAESVPIIVVMRLHPRLVSLLRTLEAANASPEHVDAVVASLLFREQETAVANGPRAPLGASVPFFAKQSVNVSGGALCLYGETQETASQALTAVTLAISSSSDEARLATDVGRLVVVVEHRDGYLARDYSVATPPSDTNGGPLGSRLLTIRRREWDSGSIAQLSLDDALEVYEAAFIEEQEINGNSDALAGPLSLEISVRAAFEIREQTRGMRGSAFLVDVDASGGARSSSSSIPPIVMFSQWDGLENVRSLLCKPPPQSASLLCFSSSETTTTGTLVPGPRQSLALLQRLDHAIQVGTGTHHTWESPRSDSTSATDILQSFKQFLRTIDQDDFFPREDNGGGDDTANNTIESTVSLALDGEQTATSRADMDPVEKTWEFMARNADSTELTQQLLQEFLVFLSNTRVFPAPHPDNNTELATLVRLRHEEIQGRAVASSFTTAAQEMFKQPADAFAVLIQTGEWKVKRDVAFALAQAGFSSQECSELVGAMPRFNVQTRQASQAHWRAMNHVLQLCTAGASVLLPVAFMRKAVHECIAYHSRSGNGGLSVDPLVLVDLQSFIPDRLRSSIGGSFYLHCIVEAFKHGDR